MSARAKLGRVGLGFAAAIAPGFVGLALAMMAARGPHAGAWIALAAAALVAIGSIVLAARARRALGLVAVPSITLVAVFLSSQCASPIPAAPRFEGALPDAHPPQGMSVARVDTGIVHRSAAFGFRGGSMFEARDFAMNAVLVRHPKGDVLLDTGLGEDIDAQVQAFPALFRWMTPYERGRSTAARLEATGYDRAALHAILLTRALGSRERPWRALALGARRRPRPGPRGGAAVHRRRRGGDGAHARHRRRALPDVRVRRSALLRVRLELRRPR